PPGRRNTPTERGALSVKQPAPAAGQEPPADEAGPSSRGSFWFWLLALGAGALAIVWVVQDEVIHSSILVGNAVPPIPALAAVLVMTAATVAAGGRRGRGVSRSTALQSERTHGRILRIYLL